MAKKIPHYWTKGRYRPVPPDIAHRGGTRVEMGSQHDPSVVRISGPVRTQLAGGYILYDNADEGNGERCKLRDAIRDRPDTVPMRQPKW